MPEGLSLEGATKLGEEVSEQYAVSPARFYLYKLHAYVGSKVFPYGMHFPGKTVFQYHADIVGRGGDAYGR